MDAYVFAAILVGGALHAGWNAVIRIRLDRFSSILLLSIAQCAVAAAMLPFLPAPAAASWPWLAASIVLHTGYKLFLVRAYEHGELSQVYPLARGAAPMLVAVFALVALGETKTAAEIAAILAIALGVILMSLRGGADLGRLSAHAAGFALITACFVAAYTVVDGMGARLAGNATAFTMWMFTGDGFLMVAYALATRGTTGWRRLWPEWRGGLVAGAMSVGSYWIAIWAMTKAPIALVAALRESSVLFAMLFAIWFLGERATVWRWAAAGLIVAGVVAMRL